jgi:cell division protein FtsB
MKWLLLILSLLLGYLQYRLWIGEGSLAHAHRLEGEIQKQTAENDRMRERNRILDVEVKELKTGLDTIEERARHDIGLIKNDETFFMVVEDKKLVVDKKKADHE